MGSEKCALLFWSPLATAISPLALILILGFGILSAQAEPIASNTTLTLTSGGTAVTTLVRGNVVSLIATVTAGGVPVTPGQVDFCDASVSYCTDIHLIGTAQLSKAGVAQVKFLPGNGTHRYRAVFRGTNSYAPSSSLSLPLVVSGFNATAMEISSSGDIGDYTLTAIVGGSGDTYPTGDVSFLNASSGNTILGSASLAANSPVWRFLVSSTIPVSPDHPSLGVLGDFNGDGVQDVATVAPDGRTAMAALGDGKGAFAAAPVLNFDLPTHFEPPLVADFDGDGTPDLAVTDETFIIVLRGNGDGTFSLKATSSMGSPLALLSWTTGDFNHDGIPDIALISGTVILIFRGNGDGTFSASPAVPTAIPQNSSHIFSGDFNDDGVSDLAVCGTTWTTSVLNPTPISSQMTILLANGDETFKVTQTDNLAATAISSSIVIADFNEDGKPDLAVNHSGLGVDILFGNGDGTFSPAFQVGTSPSSSGAPLAFGDFNGNGHVGLMTGNLVFSGNGDGTFGEFQTAQIWDSWLAIADFNGDGRSDIASGSSVNRRASVAFSVNQIATANISGVSIPVATGSAQAIASFPGDSNYLPSNSTSTTLYAAQGTPTVTLTASPNPASYGSPVVVTATVSGSGLTPTGSVQLYDGSAALGSFTLNSGGSATYTSTGLDVRIHSIIANYSGDSKYLSSKSAVLSLMVTKPVPTAGLTTSASFLPPGTSATFTATVAGGSTAPTGSVAFLDGTTQLAQIALNSSGVATYTTTSLAEGTHTLVAAYSGDSNYAAVTSSSVHVVSSSKPFLTVTGTTVTIGPGATWGNTSTISITPAQGFVGIVALTAAVTSGPSGGQYPPTVNFGSVSSVSITGPSPATATLTVVTTAPHRATLAYPRRPANKWFADLTAALACILLFGIPSRRRALRNTLGLLALLCASFATIIGCGGGKSGGGGTTISGTTPGAYIITVTATSGSISQPGAVSLTVQ